MNEDDDDEFVAGGPDFKQLMQVFDTHKLPEGIKSMYQRYAGMCPRANKKLLLLIMGYSPFAGVDQPPKFIAGLPITLRLIEIDGQKFILVVNAAVCRYDDNDTDPTGATVSASTYRHGLDFFDLQKQDYYRASVRTLQKLHPDLFHKQDMNMYVLKEKSDKSKKKRGKKILAVLSVKSLRDLQNADPQMWGAGNSLSDDVPVIFCNLYPPSMNQDGTLPLYVADRLNKYQFTAEPEGNTNRAGHGLANLKFYLKKVEPMTQDAWCHPGLWKQCSTKDAEQKDLAQEYTYLAIRHIYEKSACQWLDVLHYRYCKQTGVKSLAEMIAMLLRLEDNKHIKFVHLKNSYSKSKEYSLKPVTDINDHYNVQQYQEFLAKSNIHCMQCPGGVYVENASPCRAAGDSGKESVDNEVVVISRDDEGVQKSKKRTLESASAADDATRVEKLKALFANSTKFWQHIAAASQTFNEPIEDACDTLVANSSRPAACASGSVKKAKSSNRDDEDARNTSVRNDVGSAATGSEQPTSTIRKLIQKAMNPSSGDESA